MFVPFHRNYDFARYSFRREVNSREMCAGLTFSGRCIYCVILCSMLVCAVQFAFEALGSSGAR